MTGWGDEQHDDRVRAGAMGVAGTPPAGPNGRQTRGLTVRLVGNMDAANPWKTLDSLGGVMMRQREPGGVAGASSNEKCQLMKGHPYETNRLLDVSRLSAAHHGRIRGGAERSGVWRDDGHRHHESLDCP